MSFSWRKSVVQKSWYFFKTICENVLQKIIIHYFCLDTYKHNSLKVLLINDFLFLSWSCANLSAFQSHRVRWIARKREKEREREDNCHFVNRDCRFYDFMGYICSKSFACNSQLQHGYYWPNGYTAAIQSLALCNVCFCGHPAGYFLAIILFIITKWFISSSPASLLHSCSLLFGAFKSLSLPCLPYYSSHISQ